MSHSGTPVLGAADGALRGSYSASTKGSGVSTTRSMGTFVTGSHAGSVLRAWPELEPARRTSTTLRRMVEPATPRSLRQRAPEGDASPPFDPVTVDRAYLQERARRRARSERLQARRRASLRFWFVLLVLLTVTVGLTVTIWREIERLFGL